MKKPQLDAATVKVLKRLLATPPKPHDEMKVGRPAQSKKKKADPKGRASSSKPRDA
ncbi:hypothetical protein BPNPMPFG_007285 (plasmid) [Mesorhizobium sp. AR07]|uniref:hypothetical protein n=1 Tax=Mesorhizobium sp. AR07 TaxID=2865838 RepID=UPI00215FEC49|nr:hypothetical protein [Mesorhizobium sp. AR07]UVK48790.1 hypothetical protein BPNPMPFG_007285 [Mesorhizobium sp. AR07]